MANIPDEMPAFLPSFGRRVGKALGLQKRTLLKELLPVLLPVLPESGELVEPRIWFEAPVKSVCMEIGFGGGEFLAQQVQAHPETGFIGCEPYLNGVASFLREIPPGSYKNVRVWNDDARLLLARLKSGCLDTVFILFPDPWPKKRHHKRRLVSSAMLDILADKIKPGGTLLLATDHPDYAEWMLAHLLQHPAFSWTAKEPSDWKNPPKYWVSTRYEGKTRNEGRPPVFLHFLRCNDKNA